MALSIFTQYAFKGHRCDRSWIQNRSHLRPLNSRWVKMLRPILAVAEQHKLKGQQLWFPLPKIEVWGMKVHKKKVAEFNSAVCFPLRTWQCPKTVFGNPFRVIWVPYESHIWQDCSILMCEVCKCTKSRSPNAMETSISLSDRDSVLKPPWGPQLGSQGYPRKVTLGWITQFSNVRYESALNQSSWIQWWSLFHPQNNTVSEKKSAGPQLGSRGYPTKVTLCRMA